MFPVIRKLLAILTLAAFIAPVAGAVCVQPEGCAADMSAHACCDTPLMDDCADCSGQDDASRNAEPAQRRANTAPTMVLLQPPVALSNSQLPVTMPATPDGAFPRDVGHRLSLLSVLVV